MPARDRILTASTFALAALAWVVVAVLFTNVSPVGDATAQLGGALLLGIAVGLTAWPVLAALARRGGEEAAVGAWTRGARRAGLMGFAVAVLVVLRGLGAFSLPMALFVAGMVVLVEVAFLLRR